MVEIRVDPAVPALAAAVAAWISTATLTAISIFSVMGLTTALGGGRVAPPPSIYPPPPAAPGNTETPVPAPDPLMCGPGPPVPPPPLPPLFKAECICAGVMEVGVSDARDGAPPRGRKGSTCCPDLSRPGMREPISVWLGSSHEIIIFTGVFGAKIWIDASPPSCCERVSWDTD